MLPAAGAGMWVTGRGGVASGGFFASFAGCPVCGTYLWAVKRHMLMEGQGEDLVQPMMREKVDKQ